MGFKRYAANARLLCGAATGLAMMATATPAFAQDNDDPEAGEGNTIVVTGIRGAIETSLEAKRESTSIVEVISRVCPVLRLSVFAVGRSRSRSVVLAPISRSRF